MTDNSLPFLLDESGDVPMKNEAVDWSEDVARVKRAAFEGRDEDLVVADAPGRLTAELDVVVEPADAMVVLASDERADEIEAWRARADRLDVAVRWVLVSVLHADVEPGWVTGFDSAAGFEWTLESDGVREGVVRSIDRGDFEERGLAAYDDTSARMIRQLSTDLLESAVQPDSGG